MEASRATDEVPRVEALRRYRVLDTPPEPAFDDLTFLAAHMCGTPIALISLVNANRQWFKSKVGLTITETPREFSFCAHAILQSDLLVVRDALEDKRFATNPLVVGKPKIRFYAGAPLETPDGHRVGTLCVLDYIPRDLSPEQRQALQALSRQVVSQLELRRKLADLARTTTEVAERTRAQEVAETMAHVVQEFVGALAVAQASERIASSVVRLLRGRRATLFRLDGTTGSLVCVAMAGEGDREKWIGQTLAAGEGAAGRAVVEDRVIQIPDYFDDPQTTSPQWLRERYRGEGFGAVIAVPLKAQNETIGALTLVDVSGRIFTDDECRILATFADLAALALGTARLSEERVARLRVAEALLDIARATNSTLELKQILTVLAQRAAQAVGATRCSINVWHEGHLVPVMSQFADGHSDPALWAKFKAMERHHLEDMPVNAEAIRTKRPVTIQDTLSSDLIAPYWRDAYGIRAALVVPLVRQDKVVGTLILDQTEGPYSWQQAQIDLAMTIANHAALVMENARLYEQVQLRLGHATALVEMASAVNSTMELRPLLREIARRTALAVGVDRCSIFLCEEDGSLRAVMSQFANGHTDPELWSKFKDISQSRVEEIKALSDAIRLAQPVLVEDATTSELVPRWWTETFAVKNMVAVPLIRKDVAVGVLHLSNTVARRPIEEDQIALARTIATQVALVIDNARLYQEARRQLSELRTTQAQVIQAGRLAALGELVSGVAHELNNPLAIVMGQAELLKRKSSDPLVNDKSEKILRAAARAARIISELRTFARPQSTQPSAVEFAEVLERALALRQETLQANGISVVQEIVPGLPPVWGDAQQLEQVVLNLLLNAEQALAKSGNQPRIMLRLTAGDDSVRLTVSDTGPGIAPEILPRIFEPFFTTKPVGQGTGLGLSISYGIIQAHHGRIWAESAPGQGATVVVELPAYSGYASHQAASDPPRHANLRRGHVLVVDDEEDVADTLRALFESLGQEVTVAIGGERGWEELGKPGVQYDLVTVDLKMPDLSGPKLWERLIGAGSYLAERVVFVTGDTVDRDTQRFLKETGRPVVSKPFGLSDLATVLAERLSSS